MGVHLRSLEAGNPSEVRSVTHEASGGGTRVDLNTLAKSGCGLFVSVDTSQDRSHPAREMFIVGSSIAGRHTGFLLLDGDDRRVVPSEGERVAGFGYAQLSKGFSLGLGDDPRRLYEPARVNNRFVDQTTHLKGAGAMVSFDVDSANRLLVRTSGRTALLQVTAIDRLGLLGATSHTRLQAAG